MKILNKIIEENDTGNFGHENIFQQFNEPPTDSLYNSMKEYIPDAYMFHELVSYLNCAN